MRLRAPPRLTLLLAAMLAVAFCAALGLVSRNLTETRLREEETILRSDVLLFEEAMGSQLESVDPTAVQKRVQRIGRAIGARFTLIRKDGTVLADSESDPDVMDNHGTRVEVLAALTEEFGTTRRFSDTLRAEFLYVARTVRREGAHLGWIRASVRTAQLRSKPSASQVALFVLAMIAGSGALASGAFGGIALVRRRRGNATRFPSAPG